MYVYELSLGNDLEPFFQQWAMVPKQLTLSFQGAPTTLPHPAWITLITSQFLHGSIWHLGSNMLFLWVFGDNIEAVAGHGRFLLYYLMGGLFAGLAHMVFNIHSAIPAIGASGRSHARRTAR